MASRHLAWMAILLGTWLVAAAGAAAAPPGKPAIVLTAFGTSTAAADTYEHVAALARKRFPGYEIRWAFTSQKVSKKLWQERRQQLPGLPQVLRELHDAGFTRVAVQSLHVVPGAEWDEVVKESRLVPGLRVALGQPLLNGPQDQQRVLELLEPTFPRDLEHTAVVLVAHGSPTPAGEAVYLEFNRRLRSRHRDHKVFLGTVQNQPSGEAALAAVRASGATSVQFIPLLLVAGEHIRQDIMGDAPKSWKSRLEAGGTIKVLDIPSPGLGYRDNIVQIYLDHLDQALQTLAP